MPRVGLAIIISLLTFSASGLSALMVDEPCTGYEQSAGDDAACPPTCVTCGCCAQAAEPATLAVALVSADPIAHAIGFIPQIPQTPAHEILHVPKLRLS